MKNEEKKIMKKDVEDRRCIRDINVRLSVKNIDRKRIWKQYMKIINEENDWDQMINAAVVFEQHKRGWTTHLE